MITVKQEIEATFLNIDKDAMRARLASVGFKLITPEYIVKRRTFDFSSVDPGKNKWARVRKEANKTTMSIKEVRGAGINDTYELNLVVDDFDRASEFLQECGISVKSFQENKRELWVKDNIEATIDTWPGLEPFIEIEGGDEQSVRSIAVKLGFDFKEATFGSIDMVYEKLLGIPANEIISLPEITFAKPPQKNAV